MAASNPTTERLIRHYPRHPIKCAIIGDSLTKYVHNHFTPSDPEAPCFISYCGASYADIPLLLQYVPSSVNTLIVHVGTVDIARNGSSSSLERLTLLVEEIRQKRPEIKKIGVSLPLPRGPNRRRRGSNQRFVKWFNGQVSKFKTGVRHLCRRKELGPGVRYIDHGFTSLPLWRFLAADGLHTSFEGVGLLAQHFKAELNYPLHRWQPTPFVARSRCPGRRSGDAAASTPPPSIPPPPPPVPERRYNTRKTYAMAAQQAVPEQSN
ncbi:hypothetical protein V5799_012503 [Amblyomma americanum]|uniref:Uncharacterized protein n=1 Tax=Amblyomma americanum TaxID=6943 RepID=A0AAQ4DEW6_AMBAM